MNSVDKTSDGDYLVSARFTSAIYKISGTDGSILWQLGGRNSSFEQDFVFSYQHDARFIEENATTTIISFLDNASNGRVHSANTSSALIVALDTASTPKKARVIQQFNRPDGKLSHLRGNMQVLPNTNVLVDWSSHAYITEFSADGTLLQEVRFASERFVDYRAFKFPFIASPKEDPVLIFYAFGASPQRMTSVFYVSWNGATEVDSWNFYGPVGCSSSPVLIGRKSKDGFETSFVFDDYVEWSIAEAVSATGVKLRNSSIMRVTTLIGYEFNLCTLNNSNDALEVLMQDHQPVIILESAADNYPTVSLTQRLVESSHIFLLLCISVFLFSTLCIGYYFRTRRHWCLYKVICQG